MKRIIPVTNRTKKIREQYLNTPMQTGRAPQYIYGNHPATLHWLVGFYNSREALTNTQRRSLAQKYELENSKVIIDDYELLVGKPDFYMTDDEKTLFNELYEKNKMATYVHYDGRNDHTALDYRKLLKVGIEGILDEIYEEKSKLTFSQKTIAEDIEKEDFYNACIIELKALIEYAGRYESELRKLADKASCQRRSELIAMADNLAQSPRYGAKTFWQALQSMHFYTFVLRGLYSAGRPDQDLIKYYENDIKNGILTREFAQELIDNYCLACASYVASYDTIGLMVGGTNESGETVENELTWMFLTAISHINMTDPNIGLCVSSNTSDEIIKYALSIIGQGFAFPSFWNDDGIVKALIERGYNEKDAHRYINSTCVELTVIGKSASWTTAPYHNLAQILLDTLSIEDYEDFDSLKKAYFELIKRRITEENHKINHLKLERSRNPSEPMLHSCLVDDCIGRGRSVGQGGAIYNQTLPNFLGYANSIDGLFAVKTLVYDNGELSLDDYKEALFNNFVGYEMLRNHILNDIPHYGNDIAEIDLIAVELADCIQDACEKLYSFEGDALIPGIFSFSYHALYGSKTPATPDGRLSGEPLADSAGPAQGRDVNSPTAALRSGTVWGPCRFTGGVAQNIKLSKSFFSEDKIDSLVALIRVFTQIGGCELQINTVDRATLEDAIKNPDAHSDLIVRVGGYCDYFNRLSYALKREIIDRTEY